MVGIRSMLPAIETRHFGGVYMQKEDRISILALFIALAASMLGNIYLAAQLDMQQEQSAEKRCVERGGELLGGKYCVKPGSVLDK